jgi:16S rRNA G527 N7-methylase RsmG
VLLEPRQKRWAFLRLVVRELELDAEVSDRRYQEYPLGGAGFDVITVRALGDSVALLPWARSRLLPGGALLVWSTSAGEASLAGEVGWRVVSSALAGLERGRLVQLQPSFT